MHAAVVSSFDRPPQYTTFADPTPSGPHEIVVDVLASGLHPRVRSQSAGSHYASIDELPLVPGIDGVGRTATGELRYFVLDDTTMGAMAERTVIDVRRSIALVPDADPLAIAAAMNPAMSSWAALRRRIDFRPGQSVLVLGATGSAGQLAVQVAKHLGASRVVGAGRDAARLETLSDLGADAAVSLVGTPDEIAERLASEAADVDVVLDYVWGSATASAMTAIVMGRTDRGRPLSWIEIGSLGGLTAEIPSAALRAAHLQLVGSGQGSVSTADIVAELPALAAEITKGTFALTVRAVPLSDVEAAWLDAERGDERVVITP
ncbi:MAG TPA: zinc-binding alcohol dehydrogenase family protein [Galbitalea sp.]|jgi:NADPH:quinone reductase-like Zn-dependent oxidoreductase|nr:zinc-binding alcohol dehydrogenase family protein [Galbitalea sp.]